MTKTYIFKLASSKMESLLQQLKRCRLTYWRRISTTILPFQVKKPHNILNPNGENNNGLLFIIIIIIIISKNLQRQQAEQRVLSHFSSL